MKREFATFRVRSVAVINGKVTKIVDDIKVEVMTKVQGYAMVRRPGCVPFVAEQKRLKPA